MSGVPWTDHGQWKIGGGLNLRVAKDGALAGFSTYVQLVPTIDLGMVNIESNFYETTGINEDPIGNVSNSICREIELLLMP